MVWVRRRILPVVTDRWHPRDFVREPEWRWGLRTGGLGKSTGPYAGPGSAASHKRARCPASQDFFSPDPFFLQDERLFLTQGGYLTRWGATLPGVANEHA